LPHDVRGTEGKPRNSPELATGEIEEAQSGGGRIATEEGIDLSSEGRVRELETAEGIQVVGEAPELRGNVALEQDQEAA
jgi:hypothetical protein